MDVKPIRSEQDLAAALAEIERLMDLEPPIGSPDGDHLAVLATLVEAYEDRGFPFTRADPIAAIELMMADKRLTRRDLEPIIGARGRVSEVLNRKRELSKEMIRGLSELLAIPVDILIQPYPLARDGGPRHRPRTSPLGRRRAA
jgi:HTH-type transcriptional regulator / antitoxin HigA